MATTTVRQPLLLYALVFSVALAFSIVTLASFSLLEVARARAIGAPAIMLAQGEIRRLIVLGMFGALAAGSLLALMISRLILPPLSALRDVAAQVATDSSSEGTPNEIAEIAQTFRRTVRKLEQEREQIAKQHEELERMQAGLIRASKLASVGRLAAGIAHEIGNPLAAVRGYLSIMQGGLPEEQQREVLARSIAELNRIHETIKKLLTYARKEEPEGEVAPLSARSVLDDAIALLRGHPAFRGVAIEAEVGEDAAVLGHAGPLGQVLVNLLLNAAQAMNGVASPRIRVTSERSGDHVVLAVEDAGPGIPRDKLEQIFDPFFTTKPPGEGTGLGLAVSRALVERMGGDLQAKSEPGSGARFEVRLKAVATAP